MIVGLTGGIACGKSTISAYLKTQGIPVIDGDVVARQIVEVGSEGLAQIIAAFGSEYLNEDGSLNRAMLGRTVFANKDALNRLNGITKPLLLQAFQEQIAAYNNHPMVVLDMALLLEDSDYLALVDEVWLVTVSPEEQLDRLMHRNGYDIDEAKNRIASQMSDELRKPYANVVIDNSGTIRETLAQVERVLYNRLVNDNITIES